MTTLEVNWLVSQERSRELSNLLYLYPNKKYQTLTYFGVDTSLLKNFVINNKLKGIDRVVPVGQSLDISLMWDGYDIVSTLSRCIEIK